MVPCPVDPALAGFPKAIYACGDFSVLDSGAVIPIAGTSQCAVTGSYVSDDETHPVLITLDEQGNTLNQVTKAEPLGSLTAGVASDRILATQKDSATSGIRFSMISASNLDPIYGKNIADITGTHSFEQFPDGRLALIVDFEQHVEITMVNADGSSAWAKRYESSEFGVAAGGIAGQGQIVYLAIMADGLALIVSKSEIDFNTFAAESSVSITQLESNGNIRWSKNYTGLKSQAPPLVRSTMDGAFYLSALETATTSVPPSLNSRVFRLDAAGNVVWGKLFSDLSILPSVTFLGNQTILAGIRSAVGGEDAVLISIDDAGNISGQVQLDQGASDHVSVTGAFGDKVYLTFTSEIEGPDPLGNPVPLRTIFIGTMNSQLGGMQWRKIIEQSRSFHLHNDMSNGRLIMSSFDDETRRIRAFTVDEQLIEDSPCPLLVDESPTVIPQNLVPTDSSLSPTDLVVTVSDFTPEIVDGRIPLVDFTIGEASLRDVSSNGGDCPSPILQISRSGASMVELQLTGTTGCSYTIQKAFSPGPGLWADLETVVGDGSDIIRAYTTDDAEVYFRVIVSTP